MHIAIVSPYPPSITGIGQYGYYLSRALAQSNVFEQITVLTGAPASRPCPLPTSPDCIRTYHAWRQNSPLIAGSLFQSLKQIQPDLIWYNLGVSVFGNSPLANLSGFLSLKLARSLKIPSVATLHEVAELTDLAKLKAPGGPLAMTGARLLTNLVNHADVVCVTLMKYLDWFAQHKPTTNCLHIPLGAYHNPEFLPLPKSNHLLFFSSLAPFKGLEVLLDAFYLLKQTHPDLALTIAGAEHARFPGYIDRLLKQYPAHPGLQVYMNPPEDQVKELFRHARLVVVPYTASTGSSSVLSQAALWGRPVVASDLPEVKQAAAENDLKFSYFESGHPGRLASSIEFLLDNPAAIDLQVMSNFLAVQKIRPEKICQLYLQAFNLAFDRCNIPTTLAMHQWGQPCATAD